MAAFDIIESDMFDGVNGKENLDKKIDLTKVKSLQMAISNRGIPSDVVDAVLDAFGYERLEDIKVVDYKKVCDEMSKEIK